MKWTKFLILVMMLFALPFSSFAWGMLGHRVAGGIAEHYLTPKTRTAIKKLLGNESIAMTANWADFIKSDRKYDYLSPWHYINLPSGMKQMELDRYLKNDTATDLYVKINMLVKALKSKKLSSERQIFYLKLLIHLVGDAHQPMHTARPEDRGGNGIKVYWFNAPTNLHRVWDEHLVEYQQLSYTEHIAAINFATPAQVKTWQNDPLNKWIWESYQVAEKLYGDIKPDEHLGYSYNFRNVNIMNQQLLKAGIRLSGVLNSIFG